MAGHKEMLSEVFCEVLENFAFMFGDPVTPDELPPLEEPLLEVKMTFTGKFKGALVLAVSSGVATEVAANVLGTDPDDESAAARARDAMKEVLNVTCGHVLSSLAGEQEAFDLTPPTVRELDREEWTAHLRDPDTAAFNIEEYPALLRLML